MASTTSTLHDHSDSFPPADPWRRGLVVLPSDHVYGKTALSDISWQLLDALPRRDGRPHGQLLMQERCVHSGEPLPGCCCVLPDHLAVAEKFHRLIELTPAAFHPCSGPIRIVVTEVDR